MARCAQTLCASPSKLPRLDREDGQGVCASGEPQAAATLIGVVTGPSSTRCICMSAPNSLACPRTHNPGLVHEAVVQLLPLVWRCGIGEAGPVAVRGIGGHVAWLPMSKPGSMVPTVLPSISARACWTRCRNASVSICTVARPKADRLRPQTSIYVATLPVLQGHGLATPRHVHRALGLGPLDGQPHGAASVGAGGANRRQATDPVPGLSREWPRLP